MICKWCNQQNPENNKFCMNCGKELTNNNFNNIQENTQYNNLGNNLMNNNTNNNMNNINNLNQNSYQTNNTVHNKEKANVDLAILSWFIPLAGLIILL